MPLEFVEKINGKIVANKQENTPTSKPWFDVRSNEKIYETEFTTAEQIINEWLVENKLIAESAHKTLLGDASIKHSLTHFHWYLTPQSLTLSAKQVQEVTIALQAAEINVTWLNSDDAQATLGLPRAMVKILE